MEYDIRYAYITGEAEKCRYFLWPHYIVTHKHVFLYSDETKHALILSEEQAAKYYRDELEQMIRNYRPLFTYQGFSGDGICLYRRAFECGAKHVTYEEFPFRFLSIDEPGICHVFSAFFGNFLETDFVYSEEETIVRFEEMIEEYFREVEGA